MAISKNYKDKYAEIGTMDIKATREALYQETPAELPQMYLDVNGVDQDAVFTYQDKELTKEQLDAAIARERAHYMPFFADLAPALEAKRTHQNLTSFDWRIATDEDARNFRDVLEGKGDWERVTIPHYGAPLGVATTYYRTEFELTEEDMAHLSQWICFKGVDYKAHVYINDVLVGEHTGFFAPFEFEFTKQARLGKNTCVVVVENDFSPMGNSEDYRTEVYTGEKIYAETGLGYDEPLKGWHHCPPGMGIWQDVCVEGRSDLFLSDIFVRPISPEKAELWVEVYGTKVAKRNVTLDVNVYGQNFSETVFEHMIYTPDLGQYDPNLPGWLLPMERGTNYLKFPIDIPNARLWDTTEPWLYQVQLRLKDEAGEVVDTRKGQFGMRFFRMDADCDPKGMFYLNGRKIKFRGVNSQGREQRMVYLKQFDRLLDDYLLAKVGNINYLRITQRPVQPEVYDMCDKLGLLVQTDFPAFGCMRASILGEALKQVAEMEHLIRSHPSCIMTTYINEPSMCAQNKPHRCLERLDMEAFFECADRVIHILNPERVIKPIDGDYEPPVPYGLPDYHCYTCWYNGHGVDLGMLHKGYWLPVKRGWNYGCGEFGMEGLDPLPLMKKYYPKEWLPKNDDDPWSPITIPGDPAPQTGFLHHYFFDTPKTIAQWVEASQTYQALAMNFMVRAYRRDPKMVSYAYHLFVDAYPNGWMKAMVDFEGTPKKAFWEYREASAPVMVDLRTDRFKVWEKETINIETRICNDLDEEITDAKLHYQVYLGDNLLLASKKAVVIPACDCAFQGYLPIELPAVKERSQLKIQLALIRDDGEMLSNYELDLDVFPRSNSALGKVCALGASKAFEEKLCKAYELSLLDITAADQDTTILVFDLEQYNAQEAAILKLVEDGAKILFFTLPMGTTKIAGTEISVSRPATRPLHFVARNSEHPMVADLQKHDIRYWFDEEKGFISPILKESFDAEGFEGILTTKKRVNDPNSKLKGVTSGIWSKTFAAAERKHGNGWIRICQIDLQNRILTNPVATTLLERMIKD